MLLVLVKSLPPKWLKHIQSVRNSFEMQQILLFPKKNLPKSQSSKLVIDAISEGMLPVKEFPTVNLGCGEELTKISPCYNYRMLPPHHLIPAISTRGCFHRTIRSPTISNTHINKDQSIQSIPQFQREFLHSGHSRL